VDTRRVAIRVFCFVLGRRAFCFVLFCFVLFGRRGAREEEKCSGLMSVLCGERKRPIVLCLCVPGGMQCVYTCPRRSRRGGEIS